MALIGCARVKTRGRGDGDARDLPQIFGGTATWLVTADRRGRRLAVVAQQWDRPTLLVDESEVVGSVGSKMHFAYFAQRDPEELRTDP